MSDVHVAVLVLTFRRATELKRCLDSLGEQLAVDATWEVVVIDNDDVPSAALVVGDASRRFPVPVRYVHHSVPGLSSARNRALDESVGFDVVEFIDDDEVADVHWLRQLLEALDKTNAAVAQGHVSSVLEDGGPLWASESGVFDRVMHAPLQRIPTAASNNVAIRVAALDGARFADRFNFTGGEDTEFFLRLKKAGRVLVSAPEAIVTEVVPTSRQTYPWLFRRAYRTAAGWTVIDREANPRLVRIPIRLASAARDISIALVLLAAATRPSRRTHVLPFAVRQAAKGLGTLAGLFGAVHREYRRV